MKISLDGGVTYRDVDNDVRVIYEDIFVPGEDEYGDLYVTLTNEGVVLDVWHNEENVGTSSEMAEDIVARLAEDNA